MKMIEWFQTQPFMIKLFILIISVLSLNFLVQLVLNMLTKKYQEDSKNWVAALVSATDAPLRLVFWLIGASILAYLTSDQLELEMAYLFRKCIGIACILCLAWFAIRFIRRVERMISADLRRKVGRRGLQDEGTIRALSKCLEIIVIVIAVLLGLSLLEVSISGLVTFGGLSAAALAFSTKDMMSNFFGGLMIYLDRPFVIGDSILSPDRDIEGTVESIGWRLTTIRRLDKRPLYVPNTVFNSVSVVNSSRMSHRRIQQFLAVRYQDMAVVPAILKEMRHFLEQHPDVDTACPLFVNIEDFESFSVKILVYALIRTTEWVPSRKVQDEIMLKLMQIIEKHGAECPFPTQIMQIPDKVKILLSP